MQIISAERGGFGGRDERARVESGRKDRAMEMCLWMLTWVAPYVRGGSPMRGMVLDEGTKLTNAVGRNRFAPLLRFILPVLAIAVLGGCDPAISLHPLYTERDVTFDSSLLGTWRADDDSEPIVIEQAENNSYRLTLSDDDSTNAKHVFSAHLVRLSGYLFLDAVQQKTAGEGDSDHPLEIPGHIICRVWIVQGSIRLAYLDEAGVSEQDPAGKTVVEDFGAVLAGSTADLQRFVVEHADDRTVFDPGDPLFAQR
jgi:hypothetical protein